MIPSFSKIHWIQLGCIVLVNLISRQELITQLLYGLFYSKKVIKDFLNMYVAIEYQLLPYLL